jgi:hypothetical protein
MPLKKKIYDYNEFKKNRLKDFHMKSLTQIRKIIEIIT